MIFLFRNRHHENLIQLFICRPSANHWFLPGTCIEYRKIWSKILRMHRSDTPIPRNYLGNLFTVYLVFSKFQMRLANAQLSRSYRSRCNMVAGYSPAPCLKVVPRGRDIRFFHTNDHCYTSHAKGAEPPTTDNTECCIQRDSLQLSRFTVLNTW